MGTVAHGALGFTEVKVLPLSPWHQGDAKAKPGALSAGEVSGRWGSQDGGRGLGEGSAFGGDLRLQGLVMAASVMRGSRPGGGRELR